ncbi:MAG: hypothetical protein HKM04_08065 [Legionellales bacterium]|nr:hypothetical protein [Legionellales bacterium]
MTDCWNIKIHSENKKNTLGIDKGQYQGNVTEAIKKIEEFCADPAITIEMKSMRGYGTMTISNANNGYSASHSYNPYGIDIEMMLNYIELANAPEPNSSFRFR